ncbi:hypothetical protein [Candidatus Pantoea floridensis]|uniref:Uncharacterized protein n=1 Tax=Candidatus Pantoea floridensis TaxID=1938870 RepID=A0A286DR89_9GAMM|nr:hypothetical protein [Pantoea floridensis]PIF07518.1 hypothetical protein BX596_5030 [Enterobacteriaceae bacterium JKS000233]SOD61190.1 hypothetical protein SAMN06273570_5014 [Pantoea floridensis]
MKKQHTGAAQAGVQTEIPGLTPGLAESLAALTELGKHRLSASEEHEFLRFTLHDMAQQVADTVQGNALPLSSFRAWIVASHIVHAQFGSRGEVVWGRASSSLAARLNDISAGLSPDTGKQQA